MKYTQGALHHVIGNLREAIGDPLVKERRASPDLHAFIHERDGGYVIERAEVRAVRGGDPWTQVQNSDAEVPFLSIPSLAWTSDHSPGALLRADCDDPVPFHLRTDELDELQDWADSPAKLSIRLLTGRGGLGKTRLILEFCGQMRKRGWRSGFLQTSLGALTPERWAASFSRDVPTLVVVDYAERQSAHIPTLVQAVNAAVTGSQLSRVRLLFLARAVGDWWERLKQHDGVGDVIARLGKWEALRPLAEKVEQRKDSFAKAAEHFAAKLGGGRVSDGPGDLEREQYNSVLVLHMCALAAVEGVNVKDEQGILDYILDRERRFWRSKLLDLALPHTLMSAIEWAMGDIRAAGGAIDPPHAVRILRSIPLLSGQPEDRFFHLAQMLRESYPGEKKWIDPLQPDLLGEHLVQRGLQDPLVRAYRLNQLLGPPTDEDPTPE